MIKTIAKQIKQYKKAAIIAPICTFLEALVDALIPICMAAIIDKGIEVQNLSMVYRYGIIMFVLAALGLLFGVVSGIFSSRASTGLACNLRQAMFEHIQTYSFSNIDHFSPAGLVTRLTTDVTNVQQTFQMIMRMCVRAPITLILAMVLSFAIDARISMIFVAALIFLAIILIIIMVPTHKIFIQVFHKYDDLNSSVQENVSAIRAVKSFVREDFENTKFKKAADNIYKLFVKAESRLAINWPAMHFTSYACIIIISWIGAKYVAGGTLTTGNLTVLFTYVSNILTSLMMLSMVFVMIVMSLASGDRIAEVLNEQADITSPKNGLTTVADGSIDFENVVFSYNKNSKKPVLQDINFHIKSGETIGIIGGTGSSKSSLVNLISRLYDINQGCVKIGGVDVRKYDLETLRNNVAVVLQNNVLFSGTILDNLRWGKEDATEEECKYACKLACADEFINRLPDGYNTYIEQGGTNVSGGQKQRLCIARALMKSPKVLILDDSTSAVDTATDANIRRAFREEIPGTTKLIIAQRISSVQDADRIIVLDDGKINGMGTHEELLQTNEIYQEVYNNQIQGYGDFDKQGGEI